MSETKKFLDQNGVQYLWSKINIQDYPNNETLAAVINAIDETKADRTDIIQADWNQNDETALDYIKNRTHWVESGYKDIIPEVTLTEYTVNDTEHIFALSVDKVQEFILDKEYTVTFNGTEYPVKGVKYYVYPVGLGNASFIYYPSDTNEPFYISVGDETTYVIICPNTITEITLKVNTFISDIYKLDKKYLPNNNILNGSTEGSLRTVGSKEEDDEYVIGNYSFAEGLSTTASGYYSHAEGYNTTASGSDSHAEGSSTTASGYASHAEGLYTTASGYASHAEGSRTTASSDEQHVQGKYNIEDTENKYAHIVGNGTYSARSNAHTLDWDGNAWFAGTIKMGGTGYDDENVVEIATKTDLETYEFISIADIDEICNAVTEGSLESTDVDYLMAQLNFGVSEDELSPEEIEQLMNKLQ